MLREIATKIPIYIYFFIAMFGYSGGEYFSKSWGYKPSFVLALTILSCYAVGSICWLGIVLHKNEIARMGCIWQVLTTILTMFIGAVLLKEHLTSTQWIGAGFGLIGLLLITW